MGMRVKHFSHSDLDGIGAIILSQHAFGAQNVDYEICETHNVNEIVRNFVDDYAMGNLPHYDLIVITDLTLAAFEASWIDGAINNYDGDTKLIHYDHHDAPWMGQQRHGADFISMYDWYHVIKEKSYNGKVVPVCATSLWYDYLVENKLISATNLDIFSFTETIRLWDTWEWSKHNVELPRDLNSLLQFIGPHQFINRFIKHPNPTLRESEEAIIQVNRSQIQQYIQKKLPLVQVITSPQTGHKVGFVIADSHISELGHAICTQYPEVDYALIVDPDRKTMSFRTERTDLDVGEIARRHGGGGRETTAGAPWGDTVHFTISPDKL